MSVTRRQLCAALHIASASCTLLQRGLRHSETGMCTCRWNCVLQERAVCYIQRTVDLCSQAGTSQVMGRQDASRYRLGRMS